MPWNQEWLSFNDPLESGHSSSSTHPDFRHGQHTPRTLSDTFAQAMDVDFLNDQMNTEPYSGFDWHMDGYLVCFNNVHIMVLNK